MTRLTYQFHIIQAIRNYFLREEFLDVMTPPAVQNPGMETHIHPFVLSQAKTGNQTELYLHTSPEFFMKELLASQEGFDKIFTISYCFRDEPKSPIHRNQFLMLEWYRKNERYEKIMDDVEALVSFCQKYLTEKKVPLKNKIDSFPRVTVDELFQKYLNFSILDYLDKDKLKEKIKQDLPQVPLPDCECSWDDYFFLIFLNEIEPNLVNYPYLLVYEFPAPLSALSTISKKDSRVCERFEVYLSGVELCNCFNELTDFDEQKSRFEFQKKEKEDIYNYSLPWPEDFMSTMEKGLPKSSGIALGVERLLLSMVPIENPFFK